MSRYYLKGAALHGGRDDIEWTNFYVVNDYDDPNNVETDIWSHNIPRTEDQRKGRRGRPDKKVENFWGRGGFDILLPLQVYYEFRARQGVEYSSSYFIYPNGVGRWAIPLPLVITKDYYTSLFGDSINVNPFQHIITNCIA